MVGITGTHEPSTVKQLPHRPDPETVQRWLTIPAPFTVFCANPEIGFLDVCVDIPNLERLNLARAASRRVREDRRAQCDEPPVVGTRGLDEFSCLLRGQGLARAVLGNRKGFISLL